MSKFQRLDFYRSQTGRYHLLPFRFERVGDGEVVVTNSAGEFAYLTPGKLKALVSHTLPVTDPDYTLLRSRHFIREEDDAASLELLALKVRTRLSRLRDFTNLHLFVVTLRCDHSCHYCQVSRKTEDKAAFDMTPETASKALDFVFRSPNNAVKIEFQGGEPLLNFPLIRHIVLDAESRNLDFKKNLQFVISTTLSLATDTILEFCRDHNIHLSSSLDGPEDLHNKNRPRPGRDSHARFVEGLSRARDMVGYDSVSALMTTSPASIGRVRDIIDEYLRLGFGSIFLRHLSPYGFALKTKSFHEYNAETWLDFYREGMDYIIALNESGTRFVEHYSALVLTKMLTSNDPGFIDLMNPSGAGIAAIVFNYDGDVYASDESRMLHEMGDSSFRLGNIHKNTYEEVFTSDALLSTLEDSFTLSIPMCADCAFEPWCGADPVYHHARYGDILGRKPESEFCKRMMGTIKYLLNAMKDAQTREIFDRWVNKC